MIHDLDILLHWVNSDVIKLHAVGFPILTNYIDVANVRIEFENGCIANLTASRLSNEKIRKTRIFQSNGVLSIDYLSQKVSFSKKIDHPKKVIIQELPVENVDALEMEIRSFLHSVRHRKDVRVSGREGRRALEMALKIIQKMDQGR
jgi:predicted dehydrogenase